MAKTKQVYLSIEKGGKVVAKAPVYLRDFRARGNAGKPIFVVFEAEIVFDKEGGILLKELSYEGSK